MTTPNSTSTSRRQSVAESLHAPAGHTSAPHAHVHFHPGQNSNPASQPASLHEFPPVMEGLAGGAGAVFGTSAGGAKRHALMPTKGKDWARSKKDMKWDHKFCSRDKELRRVLMIEYCKTEVYEGGKLLTKMEAKAQEFGEMHPLETVCMFDRKPNVILRIFHVQNYPEATEFFVQKYRMYDRRNIDGWSDFKDWVYHFRPTKRAGKPVPMARTWKKRQSPGLAKVAWGMDCLKVMKVDYRPDNKKERHPDTKVAELKGFLDDADGGLRMDISGMLKPENPWADEDDDRSPSPHGDETDPNNPKIAHHTHDVFSQRLSTYVQWVTSESRLHHPDFLSPGNRRTATDAFDSGSTIIVFDNSESLSIEDTVVPAHGEIERIWRGPGTSYYEVAKDEEGNDDPTAHHKFAYDFIQRIVETIYNSVADCWESVLDVAWDHESILQDSIYEHPADESRAPELFRNSETWLKFSKLMSYHQECIGDVQEYIGDFRDEDENNDSDTAVFTWLRSVEQTFSRLNGYIEDDLIKQTDKLTDLMYKTVGIRDSQDSLRLGTSMWRLSWVTFVFLPLSFLTSFFGMNVDTFEDNPSIKWYFITAGPFMFMVIFTIFVLKWFIDRNRRPIYERGVYEQLFHDLQLSNADLWSSQGPRDVKPKGMVSKFKWWVVYRFTKGKAGYSGTTNDYDSMWSRFQQSMVRRWGLSINFDPAESDWVVDGETGNVRRGRRRNSSMKVPPKPASQPPSGARTFLPTHHHSPSISSIGQQSMRSVEGTTYAHGVEKQGGFVPNGGLAEHPGLGVATPRIAVEAATPTVQRMESELYEKLVKKPTEPAIARTISASPSQLTLESQSRSSQEGHDLHSPGSSKERKH